MNNHKIIWTEKTWNIFTGCTKCSPGCLNCYAERMVKRLQKIPSTSIKYLNGFEFTYHPMELFRPYHWKKQYKIFVNSMSDTFHENSEVRSIRNIFNTMNEYPQHTFQLLTKRPKNIPTDLSWTKNIHLGVTICNASELWKAEMILNTPAHYHFLSIEPMLENIDLQWIASPENTARYSGLREFDLVIVGGESGPGARPMHPDWVRSVRDQCSEAGVPFLFKQWGEYCYPEQMPEETYMWVDACVNLAGNGDFNKPWKVGKKKAGRILDGITHDGII